MKIEISSEYLLIVPETDFESNYLERYRNRGIEGFLKCGVSPSIIIGLKIKPKEYEVRTTKE